MPHLSIVYDIGAPIHEDCAKQLGKHAPPDFDVSIVRLDCDDDASIREQVLGAGQPDIILLFDFGSIEDVRLALDEERSSTRLIGVFEADWPNSLADLVTSHRQADAICIAGKDYYETLGPWPNTFTIPFGVDQDIFAPVVPIADRSRKVIWLGTDQEDRDETYSGLVEPLRERLRNRDIDVESRFIDQTAASPLGPGAMAEWYNSAAVILWTRDCDRIPQQLLEAAACGCAIVSTAAGCAKELVRDEFNGCLTTTNLLDVEAGLEKAVRKHETLATRWLAEIDGWTWRARSQEFFTVLRDVAQTGTVSKQHGGPDRRVDLFDQVTVFLTTVGAPSYDECLRCLVRQDCVFRLEIIENVAPLSRALQMMIDRCETPYYVQLDEDMLLYPDAIRLLYEAVVGADPEVAIFSGYLFDVHLARCIQGIKIARHEIVRNYPWDLETSVFERNLRLTDDGFGIVRPPRPLNSADAEGVFGLHGTRWTPEIIYERYFTLRNWRNQVPKLQWLDRYADEFLRRFLADQSEDNFYALMGVVAGALAGDADPIRPKNFHQNKDLPGFDLARAFHDEITQASSHGGSEATDSDRRERAEAMAEKSEALAGKRRS